MKATEKYFSVALFIMLYKTVLTFESPDEILMRNQSDESYSERLSKGLALFSKCFPSRAIVTFLLLGTVYMKGGRS